MCLFAGLYLENGRCFVNPYLETKCLVTGFGFCCTCRLFELLIFLLLSGLYYQLSAFCSDKQRMAAFLAIKRKCMVVAFGARHGHYCHIQPVDHTGDLEYGGDTDLTGSILGSLVRGSLYNSANDTVVRFITGAVALLLVGCFAYAAYSYWKSRKVDPFIFLSMVVACMLGLNVFFHLAFATPYLLTRTTLIFYPCIVLLFFYLIDRGSFPASSATFLNIALSTIIIVLFSYVFIKSFNLQYCYEWKEQADTGKCLDLVAEKRAKKVLLQKWHAGVFINYYSVVEKSKYDFQIKSFQPQETVTLTQAFCDTFQHYDHAILLPPYNLQDMRNKGLSFTVLKQFPITGAAVLQIAKTN